MTVQSAPEEIKQQVNPLTAEIKNGRLADGRFALGNNIAPAERATAGYARPSARLAVLLNEMTPAEIIRKIDSGDILNIKAIDAMNIRKLAEAVNGDHSATSFVYDKLEPREQGTAVRVNVNNAIANTQSSGISPSIDFIEGVLGRGEAAPLKEPVQD